MDMYKEHSRIISLLDDKAQKTSGIAGIFLAAGLAYLKADSLKALGEAVHFAGFVTLSLAIALLLVWISTVAWCWSDV